MDDRPAREIVGANRAIVFDLFHTLTSVESSWGGGLLSTSETLGVNREAWNEQLLVRSWDRLVGVKTGPFAIIAEMAHAIDPAIPEEQIRAATENRIARFAAAVTDIPPVGAATQAEAGSAEPGAPAATRKVTGEEADEQRSHGRQDALASAIVRPRSRE